MSYVGERGFLSSPAGPPEQLYELAYDAAVDILKQQDATLASMRNRASGLLATAALAASFSTSVGLFGSASTGNRPISHQYGWALLAIVVLIGVANSIVLWPVRRWGYGPDPLRLLDAIEKDSLTGNQFYRKFTLLLAEARVRNARTLLFRVRCYQAGIILLVVEVGTMIFAIAMK
jgi:hypothetical protein